MKNASANSIELCASVDDVAIGVLDQAVVDDTGTARATRTGEKVGMFPLGCGAVVNVKCESGATLTIGCAVYTAQTADTDGNCDDDSSNSAVKIGHYVGEGETTTADTLIPVCLDVANSN